MTELVKRAIMMTLLPFLFVANYFTISVDPSMHDVSHKEYETEILEHYIEQKRLTRSRLQDLLLQRLWETSNYRICSNKTAVGRNSSTVTIEMVPKEQNFSSLVGQVDSHIYLNSKKRASQNKDELARSKKEHDVLMDDITYGIFGNCYNVSLLSEKPFIMIDRCPLIANINDVRLCHSSRPMTTFDECSINMELVPVSDTSGYIYKNIYCARCHGITNLTTWEVELLYQSVSALRFSASEQSLIFLDMLPGNPKCIPFVYPQKPKSKLLCENFKGIRHSNRYFYRHVSGELQASKEEYPLSFQILMNFGINGKGHVFFSTSSMSPIVQHTCEDDEIYDPNIQECRRVVCKHGYILVDRKCIPKTQKYDTFSQKHVNDATSSDYPLQIIYRFNVSRNDILQLKAPEACQEITDAFATMLDISVDRIVNVQIEVQNGASTEKTAEIHQIATDTGVDTNIYGNNRSNAFCNEDLNDVYLSEEYHVFTAEFSFSLLPSPKRNANNTSTDSIKKKLLNLKGSFYFTINGTEFRADNPGASTPVQLDLWCTKGQKDQKFDKEFAVIVDYDKQSDRNVTGVYVNSTGKFYPPGMYDLWFWASGNIGNISDVSTFVYVFVCDMPKIANKDCARFQIPSSNYTRLRNASLLLEHGTIVNMNEYEYVNHHENCTDIQICVPESYFIEPAMTPINVGCGENYNKVLIAEGYLSFILGIISIVVLAAVILTYIIFEKLRNLPGLNTLSLTLSLFFGELLFITSGSIKHSSDIICPVFGASLHFIFLSSFFWMNVMSYDLFRTFANRCILTRIRPTKTYFPRYSLYAWGTPGVIVGVCCILEYTKLFPSLKIGYGGPKEDYYYEYEEKSNVNITDNNPSTIKLSHEKFGCWIQEPVAALVAFGLPMIVVLFTNAIMFVRTIICIRSVTKMVSVRTRRSSGSAIGQHDVMLYVRMSLVMGFTWIFGLASSIVSSFTDKPTNTVCITLHALSLLFIILNCSQGLFIFFVFVCNKRVGALYKQFCGQCKNNMSRQASTSSIPSIPSVATVSEKTYF